jgi:hypothetical protein
VGDESFDEGLCFFLTDGTQVANYPEQHRANATMKHKATRNRYKPMVRILKNMRRRLEAEGNIPLGLAPSYFLEGLMYNVPAEKFVVSFGDTFVNAFNWILEADTKEFVCVNEQYYLLRDVSHVTWSPANCDKFLNAVGQMWSDWA